MDFGAYVSSLKEMSSMAEWEGKMWEYVRVKREKKVDQKNLKKRQFGEGQTPAEILQ